MDTDSLIVHVKTEDINKNIAKDDEKKFDTSNYELEGPLPNRKNKKVVGFIKDELGEKITKAFVGLSSKAYSYLKDGKTESKKVNGTKIYVKCLI